MSTSRKNINKNSSMIVVKSKKLSMSTTEYSKYANGLT